MVIQAHTDGAVEHTVEEPDVLSDLNLTAFIGFLRCQETIVARKWIDKCVVTNHRDPPLPAWLRTSGIVIEHVTPRALLKDGAAVRLRESPCNRTCCHSCAEPSAEYGFQWCGPWTCKNRTSRTAWQQCRSDGGCDACAYLLTSLQFSRGQRSEPSPVFLRGEALDPWTTLGSEEGESSS
jgi:hypothetical protein